MKEEKRLCFEKAEIGRKAGEEKTSFPTWDTLASRRSSLEGPSHMAIPLEVIAVYGAALGPARWFHCGQTNGWP